MINVLSGSCFNGFEARVRLCTLTCTLTGASKPLIRTLTRTLGLLPCGRLLPRLYLGRGAAENIQIIKQGDHFVNGFEARVRLCTLTCTLTRASKPLISTQKGPPSAQIRSIKTMDSRGARLCPAMRGRANPDPSLFLPRRTSG